MDVLIIVGIVILFVVIVLVVSLLKSGQMIPQDTRLVIHRAGRFSRIEGPGFVFLWPGDQVEKRISVRNHPVEIPNGGIFAYGVPNELTVNFWYQVDIETATQGDKEKQMRLTQITESEREKQMQVLVREALINQIAILEKEDVDKKFTLLEGVAALAPGKERYNKLRTGLTEELAQTLPSLGIILDTSQLLTVSARSIPPEMIQAIKRRQGRTLDSEWLKEYAASLRQQFPDISNAVLAQMLGSSEGVDLSNVKGLLFEQEGGKEASIGVKVRPDESSAPSVSIRPNGDMDQAEIGQSSSRAAVMGAKKGLTKQDLAVLKSVPRNDQPQAA